MKGGQTNVVLAYSILKETMESCSQQVPQNRHVEKWGLATLLSSGACTRFSPPKNSACPYFSDFPIYFGPSMLDLYPFFLDEIDENDVEYGDFALFFNSNGMLKHSAVVLNRSKISGEINIFQKIGKYQGGYEIMSVKKTIEVYGRFRQRDQNGNLSPNFGKEQYGETVRYYRSKNR